MPFATTPGLKGKIYVPPDFLGCSKKHHCRDCFVCQQCGDDRCRVCLQPSQEGCGDRTKINKDNPALRKGVTSCNFGAME